MSTLKEVFMKKWNLLQNQRLLRQIFKEPPTISYKKGKSLTDMLVRAKTRFHAGMVVRPVTPRIFLRFLLSPPLPRSVLFLCPRPYFLDELTRKRLPRRRDHTNQHCCNER